MERIVAYGLGTIVLLSVLAMMIPTSAQIQMADEFGVEDAMGNPNTYVVVPVNITNVQNGPIQTLKFDVIYDDSVIELISIKNGDLTPLLVGDNLAWTNILLGANNKSITLATAYKAYAIPNGSSGSVVLLNFSVKNVPGVTSPINIDLIDFASTSLQSGTAPPKNGEFTTTGVQSSQTSTTGATTTPSVSPSESSISPTPTAGVGATPTRSPGTSLGATPTPTPEEPGFGAVFAIAGLLAVAYVVLRRKQ